VTGAELQQLRHDFAGGSAPRLAARLLVHPSTVRRNCRREHVTPYVRRRVAESPLALRFLAGMRRGEEEARAEWTEL
jgi:hypothetical protein